MDLFENAINGNGKYVRPPRQIAAAICIPELEAERAPAAAEGVDTTGVVDTSILSYDVIEVISITLSCSDC